MKLEGRRRRRKTNYAGAREALGHSPKVITAERGERREAAPRIKRVEGRRLDRSSRTHFDMALIVTKSNALHKEGQRSHPIMVC